MQGNKKTFIKGGIFYKEYTDHEYLYLKMLHSNNNINIDIAIVNNIKYITMPADIVISIDTIPKNRHNSIGIKNIINNNMQFILEQINFLNNAGIFYSDCLQFLYYNNKMYLIDLDIAYNTKIDYNFDNFNLLFNFLHAFNIDTDFISAALTYKYILNNPDNDFLQAEHKNIHNKYYNPDITAKHVYYCRNKRHIQANIDNIHIYSDIGNYLLTDKILNPVTAKDWELIKII